MVDLSDAVRGRASIWGVDGLGLNGAGGNDEDEDLLEHVGLLEEIPSDSICKRRGCFFLYRLGVSCLECRQACCLLVQSTVVSTSLAMTFTDATSLPHPPKRWPNNKTTKRWTKSNQRRSPCRAT